MAQNVTLWDGTQYSDVPQIILPKTGGGDAVFTDVSGTTALASDVYSGKKFYLADGSEATGSLVWDWRGDGTETVNDAFYTDTILLKNTNFATWEPSKTASTIVATSNVGTFSADLANYEYLIRWQCQFDAAYLEGATLKNIPYRIVMEIWQAIFKRPNSLTNIQNEVYNGNTCLTLGTIPITDYYTSSGARSYAFSASYGIYAAATAATFSNSTSNTPTVTVKAPTWSARCSDTYMTVARAADLDQENSTLKRKCLIYRMKPGATERAMYGSLVNLYNNPI